MGVNNKMGAVAVIAECNPFHAGHRFLFSSVRERFPDSPLVVILSGDYVQRGDFAIGDKYLRARTVLDGGADLVLELPFPYSMFSAEGFARGGVSIAKRLGCVSQLAFACEYPDPALFSSGCDILLSDAFEKKLSARLREDPAAAYASLREEVFYEMTDAHPADFIRSPNCILGLSYWMALKDSDIIPCVFPRIRIHDDPDDDVCGGKLRERIFAGNENWDQFLLPDAARDFSSAAGEGRFPIRISSVEQAVLYALRGMTPADVSACYGCAPLAERICGAAKVCTSLEELYRRIHVLQYPLARIRRAVLSAVLGVREEEAKTEVPFSLVLAANQRGRELLKSIKKTANLPIYTKPSHAMRDGVMHDGYLRAEALYGMAFPVPRPQNWHIKMTPFIRKDERKGYASDEN